MRKITMFLIGLVFVFIVAVITGAEPRIEDGIVDLGYDHDTRDEMVTDHHKLLSVRERIDISLAESKLDTIDMQRNFRDNHEIYDRFENVTMLDGQTEVMSINGKRYIKWEFDVVGKDGSMFLVYAVRDYDGGEITYNPNWLNRDGEVVR